MKVLMLIFFTNAIASQVVDDNDCEAYKSNMNRHWDNVEIYCIPSKEGQEWTYYPPVLDEVEDNNEENQPTGKES